MVSVSSCVSLLEAIGKESCNFEGSCLLGEGSELHGWGLRFPALALGDREGVAGLELRRRALTLNLSVPLPSPLLFLADRD